MDLELHFAEALNFNISLRRGIWSLIEGIPKNFNSINYQLKRPKIATSEQYY
jgi:hypothetical protein